MTTDDDIQQDFMEDITKPNELIRFKLRPSSPVAVEIWTCPSYGHVSEARLRLLKFCTARLLLDNPEWGLWLLATHKTLQPGNRMVRYHRLWSSLEKRGTVLPTGNISEQGMRAQKDGLRFFGALEFASDQLGAVNNILKTEAAVVVAGHPPELRPAIDQLSAKGWELDEDGLSADIIETLCPLGGLILAVFGEFDDRETALAIMGNRKVNPVNLQSQQKHARSQSAKK